MIAGCSAYDPDKLSPGGDADCRGVRSPASGQLRRGQRRNGRRVARAPERAARANPVPVAGSRAMDAGLTDAQPATDANTDDAAPVEGGVDATVDAGCSAGADCCPDDPNKTEPGQCGCGVADDDSDSDGTANCHDECPNDPAKTVPGMCDCGGVETDGDSDGTADCDDMCPADGAKTAPGICGCGRIDSDMGATVSCAGLVSALRNRYRFDGSGMTVTDSRSASNGTAVNVSLSGTGSLVLAGGRHQYVDLPNGLASTLTNATFEAFVTWDGGAAWQRIFDFGSNSSGTEGSQGTSGRTYLFVTPRAAQSSTTLRVVYSENGAANEVTIDGSAALATGGMHQVVVVVDDTADQMRLYLDGALVDQVAFPGHLSALNDINNWFGRSQFSSTPSSTAPCTSSASTAPRSPPASSRSASPTAPTPPTCRNERAARTATRPRERSSMSNRAGAPTAQPLFAKVAVLPAPDPPRAACESVPACPQRCQRLPSSCRSGARTRCSCRPCSSTNPKRRRHGWPRTRTPRSLPAETRTPWMNSRFFRSRAVGVVIANGGSVLSTQASAIVYRAPSMRPKASTR